MLQPEGHGFSLLKKWGKRKAALKSPLWKGVRVFLHLPKVAESFCWCRETHPSFCRIPHSAEFLKIAIMTTSGFLLVKLKVVALVMFTICLCNVGSTMGTIYGSMYSQESIAPSGKPQYTSKATQSLGCIAPLPPFPTSTYSRTWTPKEFENHWNKILAPQRPCQTPSHCYCFFPVSVLSILLGCRLNRKWTESRFWPTDNSLADFLTFLNLGFLK